jgi:hypothetical protein
MAQKRKDRDVVGVGAKSTPDANRNYPKVSQGHGNAQKSGTPGAHGNRQLSGTANNRGSNPKTG